MNDTSLVFYDIVFEDYASVSVRMMYGSIKGAMSHIHHNYGVIYKTGVKRCRDDTMLDTIHCKVKLRAMTEL